MRKITIKNRVGEIVIFDDNKAGAVKIDCNLNAPDSGSNIRDFLSHLPDKEDFIKECYSIEQNKGLK